MKKKITKYNVLIVQVYILLTILFLHVNKIVYKEILVHFEYISAFMLVATFIYVIILKNYEKRIFFLINSAIFIGIIVLFLFTFPRYTFNEAQDKVHRELGYNNEIFDPTLYYNDNIPIIGTRVIVNKFRSLLIKYDYAICILNKDTQKIDWYKFNSFNGDYSFVKTVDISNII
ncbi:hypothetical protein PV797_11050 [Clostridiaceae bacterium M8S5]|nr:hypothetical protein PV797_11050 [Clostridiaceae bacterium M8S5]